MSPSFNELVEWLKTLDEGEQLPKTVTFPRPAAIPMPPGTQSSSMPQIFTSPQFQPAADATVINAADTAGTPMPGETAPQPTSVPVVAAVSPAKPAGDPLHPFLSGFTHDQLAQGIVIAEILDKPVALRRAAPTRLNPRHR